MKIEVRGITWSIGLLFLLMGQVASVAAQPRVSEFEPNPSGSDAPTQLVELSGFPGDAFSGCVVTVDCDTSALHVDSATAASGTFDANGLLTVSIADLENPSFTLLLVGGACPATGLPPVGLTSANVLDAIGIPDSSDDVARCSPASIDPSLAAVGGAFAFTNDEPRLVFRDASTGDWFAINDPDRGEVYDIDANNVGPGAFRSGNPFEPSFGAVNPTRSSSRTLISEFEPNPAGSDASTQLVELSGIPGTPFFGAVASVDCDTPTLTVDSAAPVAGTFDRNGLLTVSIPDLENPSFILLLVNGAAPIVGQSPVGQLTSANVLDAIGVPDVSLDEARCSPTFIDPSLAAVGEAFAYTGDEPKLVFRDASTGAWFAINDPDRGEVYDIAANNVGPGVFRSGNPFLSTFAAINPSTSEIVGPAFTSRKIHEIQGSGPTVTNPGELVEVQAVVTGLYERVSGGLATVDGFFIQEEDVDADADPGTSEGIYVFCRDNCPAVSEGDLVTVQGVAAEFLGMSQIDATVDAISVDAATSLPTATAILLPAAGRTDAEATFESVEGMRVTFPQELSVAEYFQLARFGQVVLSQGGRPRQFTDASLPDAAGYQQHLDDIARRRILLDDLNDAQNFNDPVFHPQPNGFSAGEFFRGGDVVSNLTGILHWSWAGASATDAWRVRPTRATPVAFTPLNLRSAAADDVGGGLRVASLNLLNYFTTIDEPGGNCDLQPGACRGADSVAERIRQLNKVTQALGAIDADIVGLLELENDGTDAAIASIVAELTDYDYIATGVIGDDAIKAGIIYRTSTVTPVGAFAILDSSVDATFIDTKNRPVLVQTFEENASGARFTIAVNHFKSKGSSCADLGDPDTTDGQGNCNGTRTFAAGALANFLATDPTGSGDPDFLVLGDLNAYAMEDPIKALEAAGYDNLISQFVGPDAYSFVFDGQLGYLDHALATASLTEQVTGVTLWHINADEVNLFDYNDAIQDPSEASFEVKPSANPLYSADPYRSSDHDPVIVGLDLTSPEILRCELDGNGQIDINDVRAISMRRNQLASGPDDPADADGDGIITVLDARLCVLQCTSARCAP